jgi:hypothetical protein
MKHIHYIYIGALAFLIACSSEESITTDSNEKAKEPIKLSAGIVDGSSKATTRTEPEPSFLALTKADGNNANTQLALQVNGNWKHGETTTLITKTTTATVGTATSNQNAMTEYNPVLYWDDYGTADPDNANGRTQGLTIYGVAIDSMSVTDAGLSGLLAANADWTALNWTLPANQTLATPGNIPSRHDLLISNNVQAIPNGYDGRYKFSERGSGRCLNFKHAMSKITVILTAGAGFVDKTSDNDSDVDFQNDPVVLLTSNTSTEWACTKGNVNITSGEVTLTGTSSSGDPAVITMYQASSTGHVVTKEALVMPGSKFASDDAIIARINADGNIYYVTAEKIRTAINSSTHGTDGAYSTEAGKNYIIKVTVDKTGISKVSATVTNWTNVDAVAVAPKINVTGDLGSEGSALENGNYSFYRSAYVNATSINTGYGIKNGTTNFFAEESIITKSGSTWTMSTPLYWPDHNTHYQFRCVWPQTTTEDDASKPRVKTSGDYQVIEISNVQYPSTSGYPSDLMIARPEVANQDKNCGNNESTHTKCNLYTQGICAREGNIKLTFKYMMSKVEVNLSTSGESDPNKVILTNAKVELINIKNTGEVKLGDMGVIPTGDTGYYELHPVSESPNSRLDAIVPQDITSTKFKITIFKSGDPGQGVDDIYYADIVNYTPEGWISGNHYVYNLTVTKTDVQVSATLTDWNTVNANHSIWF